MQLSKIISIFGIIIFEFSLPVKAALTCDPISSDVLNAIQEQINVFRRKHDIDDIALKNEAKAPGEEGDIEKLLKNGADQINLLAAPGHNLEFGENITSTRESLNNTIGKWIETEEQYIYDQDALKDPIMTPFTRLLSKSTDIVECAVCVRTNTSEANETAGIGCRFQSAATLPTREEPGSKNVNFATKNEPKKRETAEEGPSAKEEPSDTGSLRKKVVSKAIESSEEDSQPAQQESEEVVLDEEEIIPQGPGQTPPKKEDEPKTSEKAAPPAQPAEPIEPAKPAPKDDTNLPKQVESSEPDKKKFRKQPSKLEKRIRAFVTATLVTTTGLTILTLGSTISIALQVFK